MSAISCAIGERLRVERARLGLSQTSLGEITSAAKRTVVDWEKGASSPTAVQLSNFANTGGDVLFILTGMRSIARPGMSEAEIELFNEIVDTFWGLSDEDRRALLRQAQALHHRELMTKGETRGARRPAAAATDHTATQTFNASVGQVAGRDIVNQRKKGKPK